MPMIAPSSSLSSRVFTAIVADATDRPELKQRTWVLLTEATDGGWGLWGHAHTNEELVRTGTCRGGEAGRWPGRMSRSRLETHFLVLPGGGYATHGQNEAEPIVDRLAQLGRDATVVRYPLNSRHPAPLGPPQRGAVAARGGRVKDRCRRVLDRRTPSRSGCPDGRASLFGSTSERWPSPTTPTGATASDLPASNSCQRCSTSPAGERVPRPGRRPTRAHRRTTAVPGAAPCGRRCSPPAHRHGGHARSPR
jgi:hypothetical protein